MSTYILIINYFYGILYNERCKVYVGSMHQHEQHDVLIQKVITRAMLKQPLAYTCMNYKHNVRFCPP